MAVSRLETNRFVPSIYADLHSAMHPTQASTERPHRRLPLLSLRIRLRHPFYYLARKTLAHPNVLRPVTTLVRTGAVYGRHSARSLGCTLLVVLTSWLRVARAPHAYVPTNPHDMLKPAYLWFHSRPTFRSAAAMPARHTPQLCVWYSYIHPQHKQTHHDGCKPRHDDHAPPFARCSSNRTSASYALRISSAVTGKAAG